MSISKTFLNILTIVFTLFLYTGYRFLQIDPLSGDPAASRVYNSICGTIIVCLMTFFILSNRKSLYYNNSIVIRYIIVWLFAIIVQTLLTSESVGRFFVSLYYVTIWPISFIFFYLVSSNVKFSQRNDVVRRLVFMALLAVVLYYLTAPFSEMNRVGSIGNSYYLLCFLPWVFIIRDFRTRNLLIALLAITIIVSSKRTSILGFAIFFFVFILCAGQNRNILVKGVYVSITVIAAIVIFYYIDQNLLGGHITERFSNFEKGADTRDGIRLATLLLYQKSSVAVQLIGHGYNTVIGATPMELSAHNDYVETLYDHGLLMFLLQILIIIRLIKLSIELYRKKNPLFPALFSSVILYVMMAYTTHLILYPYYFLFLSGFWGFAEGNYVLQIQGERVSE